MATLWLFIVGVLSLLFCEPIKTAYFHNDPSLMWRLVNIFTHMVSHGSWDHLLGNFMFGAPFMLYVEHKLKSTKLFVRLFVVLGLGALGFQIVANMLTLFPSIAMIGSSGAIFGLVAVALCLYDGPLPLKIAARCILIFHLITQFQLTIISLVWPMGVAYAAHLGGIVTGILFSLRHLRRRRHRLSRPRSRAK